LFFRKLGSRKVKAAQENIFERFYLSAFFYRDHADQLYGVILPNQHIDIACPYNGTHYILLERYKRQDQKI